MMLKPFLKPNVFGVILFLFSIPLVMIFHAFLIKSLPDSLYYSFARNYGFLTLTFYLVPIFFGTWAACHGLNYFLKMLRPMFKNFLQVIVFLMLLAASFYVMLLTMFSGGSRFDVGHPYCTHDLIKSVERCEGKNFGFMQGRFHGAAMYGAAVSAVEGEILSLPKYSMEEAACETLVGRFGEGACYTGEYFADTGDTYYLNVYLRGDKVLLVKTVNAPLKTGSKEYLQFFDLRRFDREMGLHG